MKQENGNDIYSDFVFSVEFAKDTFEQEKFVKNLQKSVKHFYPSILIKNRNLNKIREKNIIKVLKDSCI